MNFRRFFLKLSLNLFPPLFFNRIHVKNISSDYAEKLFTFGKENYLYTDVVTYLSRRKQTEGMDLLYIFNAIDLNKKRDYQKRRSWTI